jgi:hypothetical protein
MLTIKDIKPYPKNVKNHPEEQIDALAKVIMEIGWRQNAEVNQKGDIVAGHGRWFVWEKYKDNTKMPPIWIMDDMGNTIHGEHDKRPLTPEQENMWRVADNKLAEKGTWNMENFAFAMDNMSFEYKEMTGYDSFDLDNKINDISAEWEGMPEVNQDKVQGAYQSVIIHFDNENDVKDFSVRVGLKITNKTKFAWFPYREKEVVKDKAFVAEDF